MTQTKQKWQDLPKRLLTVAIGAPLVFVLVYLGSPFYDVIVLGVSVVAAFEVARMVAPDSRFWHFGFPVLMSLVILGIAYGQVVVIGVVCAVTFAAWFVVEQNRPAEERATPAGMIVLYLLAALVYISVPLALLLIVRPVVNGLWWTFALFANNWLTDASALIGGRLFGKTKLAPKISGAKTVEGAAIGLAVGTLVGFAVLVVTVPLLSPVIALVVNFLISALTIIGDLIESRVKRHFHVKDAGKILPGHGGFLDRIDGLLLAVPIWYLFVMIF
ncbi:MAG: phosphatidate cytidylyltransferase [Anaerolineaceae bacterium]|nr:phosphatidate cytidylyltransferase [Anaerolineaceae bacterium]